MITNEKYYHKSTEKLVSLKTFTREWLGFKYGSNFKMYKLTDQPILPLGTYFKEKIKYIKIHVVVSIAQCSIAYNVLIKPVII